MNKSIGVLGGGQLGKMLFNAGMQLNMDLGFMDASDDSPVGKIVKNYTQGKITDAGDVLQFGKNHDIITVEIEKVNVDALRQLEKEGVSVFPQPEVIATIQDKALQKEFYKKHELPSSPFKKYDNISSLIYDIDSGHRPYPFIQKMRMDGYDGRGVQLIRSGRDLDQAFPYNFIVEELVDIDKELAVITCRGHDGKIVVYEPVEMVFLPEQNILLYQLSPARITQLQKENIQQLAQEVAEAFQIVGLLAIEFFLTRSGEILINEVAPRPHNSGHHTIEANVCSQYENHLRAIVGLPLGDTRSIIPSVMLNVLGEDGFKGPAIYQGLAEILQIPGLHLHLYGKADTKAFRKMGHITITGERPGQLIAHAELARKEFRVISSADQ